MGFVKFGYLAGHAALPVGSEDLDELLESFGESVRRFVENHSSALILKGFEQAEAALFLREETLETKPVARQAAGYDGGNAGSGPWQGLYLYPLTGTGSGEQKTRIRNPRSSGVAYQGYVQTGEYLLLYKANCLVLVIFVM